MKKLFILLLLSLFTLTVIAEEISYIKDRSSNRTLVYSQENNELVFTLLNGSLKTEVKRIPFSISSNSIRISGLHNDYDFEVTGNFMGTMVDASANAYEWCYTEMGAEGSDTRGNLNPAMSGVVFFLVGIVATEALCAVTPAVPTIVGALVVPIIAAGNGAYNLAGKVKDAFHPDNIAARKFRKLLKGKNKNVSSAVFDSLINQLAAL